MRSQPRHPLVTRILACLALAMGLALAPGCGSGEAPQAGTAGVPSDPYPLTTCAVSGEALGSMGEPVVLQRPGREVRLCCESCVKAYEADPATYDAEVDAAIIALQKPHYPLTTCLVSGEVIGASDKMVPYDHVAGNRLYRLCCEACVRSLEKGLPEYRAQLMAAYGQ